ncbi:unnamed protein product [Ilex paraguariensis]|uniref:NADH dehydrogenase subunit 6 n=1 Tax=Ilex paraguariensis TaxID=185542 RepID=A0ABC8UGB6_9AQUA
MNGGCGVLFVPVLQWSFLCFFALFYGVLLRAIQACLSVWCWVGDVLLLLAVLDAFMDGSCWLHSGCFGFCSYHTAAYCLLGVPLWGQVTCCWYLSWWVFVFGVRRTSGGACGMCRFCFAGACFGCYVFMVAVLDAAADDAVCYSTWYCCLIFLFDVLVLMSSLLDLSFSVSLLECASGMRDVGN